MLEASRAGVETLKRCDARVTAMRGVIAMADIDGDDMTRAARHTFTSVKPPGKRQCRGNKGRSDPLPKESSACASLTPAA